ncbi:hypothetical protein Ancab_026594 [Ancistrocladus abbreviatus]
MTGEFAGKSTTKGLATQSHDSSHSMPFNNSDQLQLQNDSTGGRSLVSQTAAGVTRWLRDQIWFGWAFVAVGKGLQGEDGSNLKTSCRSAVTNRQAHTDVPSDNTGKLWRRKI